MSQTPLVLQPLAQLQHKRALASSVTVRAPYVDALSRLQLRALTELHTDQAAPGAEPRRPAKARRGKAISHRLTRLRTPGGGGQGATSRTCEPDARNRNVALDCGWGRLLFTPTFDAYPDLVVKGRVASIGAGTGSEFSVLPAQNATGNWVKVTQRVPVRIAIEGKPPRTMIAGLSTEVTVFTDGRK